MKKIYSLILVLLFVTVILARSNYSGYTRKTRTTGCNCHGSSANTSISVEITGPAQVKVSTTATYQVTISGGSGTKVCADIAASAGTLLPFDSALFVSGTELITNGTKTYVNGKYTYSFNYTAPAAVGTQTLYATGLASTGSGWNFAPDKTISIVSATDINDIIIPNSFYLEQNYPNPFNPTTKIRFGLPERAFTKLTIFDMQGREVRELINSQINAGSHEVEFNAADLSSGVYYYRIASAGFNSVKKLLLIK